MLISTSAIVIRTTRTSDSGLIVDMLTEQKGRLSFAVHVGKRGRGASRQLFQCLTQVEVSFDHRPSASIQYIRSVRMLSPYSSIPSDPCKMAVAMFLAEFLAYATRGEHEDGMLFDYVRKSLLWYDAAIDTAPNFHLVFMINTLRFLGFRPDIESKTDAPYFDLLTGEYSSAKPQHPHYVSGDELRLMPLLLEADYSTMRRLAMSRTLRNRATDLILQFCRLHLPQFPEMRSLSIVRELF